MIPQQTLRDFLFYQVLGERLKGQNDWQITEIKPKPTEIKEIHGMTSKFYVIRITKYPKTSQV